MRSARVFRLVDTVAESGDLLLGSQHVLHIFHRVRPGLVDGVEQAHDAFVGATVQRALQRANRARDSRVNVGEGCGDDAGGKGGCVQLVVGMKNECDIECAGSCIRGLDAIEHPEKIAGVAERTIGRNDFETFAKPVVDGDDHGDLRGQVVGFADIGIVRVVFFVGVVKAERRHRSSQHLHGSRGGGKRAQHFHDALIERPGQGQLRRELAKGSSSLGRWPFHSR